MNKKNTLIKSLTLIIALFVAINFGFGQSIFTNPINGIAVDNPYTTGQTIDDNITVSGIGRGSGITSSAAADRYNARNWSTGGLDVNDYFYFTLTPNAGYAIDFVNFIYNGRVSPTGPVNFAIRSSLDGFTSDIGTPNATGTTIDLSSPVYQNITSAVTFRIYGWGSGGGAGTYSINDFTFNGIVRCATTTTWTAGAWNNGIPSTSINAIIADNYDTNTQGSLSACSLNINLGANLNVGDNTFVEVENDVIVDGTLTVQSFANFVQNNDTATFTNNGTTFINKSTALKQDSFYYTYWSSPVKSETIDNAFPFTPSDRRFWYNASNYIDRGDGIDDNGDDWTLSAGSDIMEPGRGYAATSSTFGFYPGNDSATFTGEFNTGDVSIGIVYNALNPFSWNFIGNPYPSAINFDAFQAANSTVIDGVAYFWSQSLPPNNSNPGNEAINLSQNDYATYTVGSGGAAGASGVIPDEYVPSGQGFFVIGLDNQNVTFTNGMRMADNTSNSKEMFKISSTKGTNETTKNKLWVDLTSDNGVFNQILIAYVDGATDTNDGLSYDAPRNLTSEVASILYTTMSYSDKKYVIQGKSPNSLNKDEIISLGFDTNIDVPTAYTLSIAQLQGAFLTNNPVYLKDNLTYTIHDLSASDYSFTSEVGEFKDRFEIVFTNQALSNDTFDVALNVLQITQVNDTQVRFSTSNSLTIKQVAIYDLLGRQLYSLEGNNSVETYNLSNLNNSVFIAKVKLSNGAIVTKKAIKE